MSDLENVRCRFAPSPTGRLHVGSVRTLLFNYLFAKKHNGELVLRLEDTDKKRSTKEFEKTILEDMAWLGLNYDEGIGRDNKGGKDYGPYRQSERAAKYMSKALELIEKGHAYYCQCSEERLKELREEQIKAKKPPRYDGCCKGEDIDHSKDGVTIRFNFEDSESVEFIDGIHGKLFFDSDKQAGDFIIIGSDGMAAFNFACAVDDGLMDISHVIRGDDHLSNTVRQIAILRAFGMTIPSYYHMPLVLGEDKKPLSKRHGHATIEDLKNDGYMAEAIINGLVMLGYRHDSGLLSLDKLVESFDEKNFSKSASVFDLQHLKGFNKDIFKDTDSNILKDLIGDEFGGVSNLKEVIDAVKEDSFDKESLVSLVSPFVKDLENVDLGEFDNDETKAMISLLKGEVSEVSDTGSEEDFKTIIGVVKSKSEVSGKKLFMPIRLVLTNERGGIELNRVMALLGKDKVLFRIKNYLEG